MVVLRRNNHQRIRPAHLGGKIGILDSFACITSWQGHGRNIDKIRLHAFTITKFARNDFGGVLAHATLADCPQNHWDEEAPIRVHEIAPSLVAWDWIHFVGRSDSACR